jgi:hypothetical protein
MRGFEISKALRWHTQAAPRLKTLPESNKITAVAASHSRAPALKEPAWGASSVNSFRLNAQRDHPQP